MCVVDHDIDPPLTVPEGVLSPAVTALSSSQLRVEWFEPLFPNGLILNYSLLLLSPAEDEGARLLTSSPSPGQLEVASLRPFTLYSFLLEVCTTVGCNSSQPGSGTTLESGEF